MNDKVVPVINKNHKEVKKFLVIFYIVGTIGFAIPYTRELFTILIPYALLLNFILLMLFHEPKIRRKDILIFTLIYVIGFSIEIIGVHTKAVFGYYTYSDGLGIKLFDTPLLIGLNWLFLVYAAMSVFDRFGMAQSLKIVLASLAMLIYDIVLEQVAPHINMWSWKDDIVPLQNYLAWFGLALFFNSLLKIFNIKTKNSLSFTILICQFSFFVLLFFILYFTNDL